MQEGLTPFALSAADLAGNVGTATVQVTLYTVAPPAPASAHVAVSTPSGGQTTVTGAAGSVEGGATVAITNTRSGESVTVTASVDGSFTVLIPAQAGDSLTVVVRDHAGNRGKYSPC